MSTLIILWLVARHYHEEGTGVFTLSLTYLSIFYLLADFGFNAHLLRQGWEEKWPNLLGTRLIWAAVLVALSLGLLPFLPFATSTFSQAVWFGAPAIVGSAVFVSCNLIFQSRHRYDLSVLSSSIGTLGGLAFFVYLVRGNYPVHFLLISQMLGWLIIGFLSLILINKLVKNTSPAYSLSFATNLVKDSWPIAATLALNVVYFRVDSFMISVMKSNTDVGIYNLAYSIFQTVLVLPTFIMNAYYPVLLKSFKEVKKIGAILLGLAVLATISIYFLAPEIIKLLTAKGFSGSIQSLQILCLSFPAFFISSLLMWVLVTRGKYKTMLLIYLIGLMVNFILNLVFIPAYSFLGSAYITAISEYLILVMQAVSLWW